MSLGELQPCGGGDAISLTKDKLLVGRRTHCDITFDSQSVSSQHCELELRDGFWHVRDLGSSNGTKVNGTRVESAKLMPGDEIAFATHTFHLNYELPEGAEPPEEEDPFALSLLEKAGLEAERRAERRRMAHEASQTTVLKRGPGFSARDQFLMEWLPDEDQAPEEGQGAQEQAPDEQLKEQE
ncbi:MAG: FHA domain-containing protein [Planctomycetaceae bacterium]